MDKIGGEGKEGAGGLHFLSGFRQLHRVGWREGLRALQIFNSRGIYSSSKFMEL